QDPTYQRVVIQEGPAILGYERFRESEERSSYGIVQTIVGSVVKAGDWTLDEEMSRTFSRIFFGAMSAAGEMISGASDAQETSAQVEVAISFILEGLRGLAESGTELPAVDEEN
ncbi:MAG TPA: TetR/AcrR family transcriptional regulator, partial [Marmoricola sp.]|nr:TetR/AcrR family transcriptional regulator [Marmoricola sp.]